MVSKSPHVFMQQEDEKKLGPGGGALREATRFTLAAGLFALGIR